jgi:hypothetical protein
MIHVLSNIENPDSGSISAKNYIDISLSLFDVSASGYFGKIQTNYSATVEKITIPDDDFINSSSYYTPIYTEKINYNEWLSKINRNFEELE